VVHDDRAVVRRDAVEVAVGDGDHRFARRARFLCDRLVRRRIGRQVVRVAEVAGRLTWLCRSVQARVSFARDQPFGYLRSRLANWRIGDFDSSPTTTHQFTNTHPMLLDGERPDGAALGHLSKLAGEQTIEGAARCVGRTSVAAAPSKPAP
jgi:hypothetical protein